MKKIISISIDEKTNKLIDNALKNFNMQVTNMGYKKGKLVNEEKMTKSSFINYCLQKNFDKTLDMFKYKIYSQSRIEKDGIDVYIDNERSEIAKPYMINIVNEISNFKKIYGCNQTYNLIEDIRRTMEFISDENDLIFLPDVIDKLIKNGKSRTVNSLILEAGFNKYRLNEIRKSISFDLNKSPKELNKSEKNELINLMEVWL